MPISPLLAPCKEKEFLELRTGFCRLLQTNYGFTGFDIPEKVMIECNKRSLLDAVDRGGRIIIPEKCTIDLGSDYANLKNNTVIEGVDILTTKITCSGTTAFKLDHVTNVIIHNLTIDGLNDHQNATGCRNLIYLAGDVNNILIERVQLLNALLKSTGGETHVHSSSHVTIRYSWLENSWQCHGIGLDDGFTNVAYYSNYIAHVGLAGSGDSCVGYGIDSHASRAEIAGNIIEKNESGMKLPDAHDVLVHHNYIEGGSKFPGIRSYEDQESGSGQAPYRQIYYDNYIDASGGYSFRFANKAYDIFLAGNLYTTGQALVRIEDKASSVYVCKDSADAALRSSPSGRLKVAAGTLLSFTDSGMNEFDPCKMRLQKYKIYLPDIKRNKQK
ncbi:MAG: hypothetical protein U0175_27090 [Caldilineaceae bacterium]